jgi:hypothetical protein
MVMEKGKNVCGEEGKGKNGRGLGKEGIKEENLRTRIQESFPRGSGGALTGRFDSRSKFVLP